MADTGNILIKTEPLEDDFKDKIIEGVLAAAAQCKSEPNSPVDGVKLEEDNSTGLHVTTDLSVSCSSVIAQYAWNGCNFTTPLVALAETHLRQHNYTSKDGLDNNSLSGNISKNDTMLPLSNPGSLNHLQTMFLCTICNHIFHSYELLVTHINDAHKSTLKLHIQNDFKKSNTNQTFKYRKILPKSEIVKKEIKLETHGKDQIPTNLENFHKCSYCSFTSIFKRIVKHHMITSHSDKKQYVLCEMCGKFLTDESCRKKHFERIHKENAVYTCIHCQFSTKYCDVFVLHTQNHLNAALQLCYICGFTCVHKGRMDNHILRHSKRKDYPCIFCDFIGYSLASLTNHLHVHDTQRPHDLSSLQSERKNFKLYQESDLIYMTKPFACEICNYRCAQSSKLKMHMQIHDFNHKTMYECYWCQMQFARKKYLTKHIQVHYDRILKCQFCSFKTHTQDSLKSHENLHTGYAKMHCFKCGYSSTHRANFTQHVNSTCTKANKKQNLKYCSRCNWSSSHRSNFVKHVNAGCANLKMIRKQKVTIKVR